MATVIDALLVTLGLDASGVKKGQKDTSAALKKTQDDAARTAKELEARGKQAAQFFGRIRNEVLALTAAFLGASSIKQFAEHLTASDAALGRLSTNVGMATQDLAAWAGAAERFGGSSSGMGASIQGLVQQFQQLKTTGTAAFVKPLALAHVDMAKFISDATPMGEKLLMLADAFHGMEAGKAQYLGQSMGLDQGTINLLMQGRIAVEALLAKQKEMNAVSRLDTEAAIARQNAWKDFGDTLEGIGRLILTDVSPAIVSVLQHMQGWLQANREWLESDIEGAIKRFAEWLKNIDWAAVELGIKAFVDNANQAATAVGGWVRIGETLLALWVGSKFLAVLANIARLKTAFLGASTASAGMAGALGKLGLYGAAAEMSVSAVDPQDKLGTWIDNNVPGAAWLDDQASKLGFGRNYEQQAQASASGYKESASDIQRLMGLGWSREQAVGIAANLFRESSGDATKVGDNGHAYGLAQWHKDRQDAFAKMFGHDIRQSNRDEQLQFLDHELRHGSEQKAGQALAAAKSAAEAARIVSRRYERPRDADGEAEKRASLANALAGALGSGPRPDAALVVGSRAAMAGRGAPAGVSSSTSQTEVKVGSININTPATDAKGIAREIGPAVRDQYAFASQTNFGLA